MGVISVHPLDGVNSSLSIQSIVSILSTMVAPQLHQKPTQINWFDGSIDCTDMPSNKILFSRTHSLILMSGFLFSIYSPRLLYLFYAKIFMLLNMYKN